MCGRLKMAPPNEESRNVRRVLVGEDGITEELVKVLHREEEAMLVIPPGMIYSPIAPE